MTTNTALLDEIDWYRKILGQIAKGYLCDVGDRWMQELARDALNRKYTETPSYRRP